MTAKDDSTSELHRLAFAKMANVLGEARARILLERHLGELGIELRTPQDLLRLSESLTQLGGIEAAVGAMLGVAAVLRGAGKSS
jgi:hypothetical protein